MLFVWTLLGCSATQASAPSGPVETLDLPRAKWGVDVPNTLKGMSLGYDGKTGMVLASGAIRPYLEFVDPALGHPVAAVQVEQIGNPTNRLRVDEAHRRVWWIGLHAGELRVYDLDQHTLLASRDGAETPGELFPIKDAAIDPATGWLWLVDGAARTVTGFSPDLKQTELVPGLGGPTAIAAAPTGDSLWIVDAPAGDDARLVRWQPSVRGTSRVTLPARSLPPRTLVVTTDGRVILGDGGVTALTADGALKWRTVVPGVVEGLVALGNDVAVATRRPGTAEASVSWVSASGAVAWTRAVGFQVNQLAADPANLRVFAMQGGDGRVSVLDAQGNVGAPLAAAEGPEELVVDPKTGTRYIVNRLGGSSIEVWKPGQGTAQTWPMGRWPTELAIDPERRLLMALGHWDSGLFLWDLSKPAPLPSIASGAPANTGDALGDLDYDASVGIAAVAFPEHGWLAVMDVAAGKTLWGHAVDEFKRKPNEGAGLLSVAVDGKRRALYVLNARPREVVAFNLDTGVETGRVGLGPWSKEMASGHILNSFYFDRVNDRLFAGPDPIAVPTLTVAPRIAPQRPFYADATSVLALQTDDHEQESLVQLDAKTLAVQKTRPLYVSDVIRPQPTYDPVGKKLYLVDLPTAKVMAWSWP